MELAALSLPCEFHAQEPISIESQDAQILLASTTFCLGATFIL